MILGLGLIYFYCTRFNLSTVSVGQERQSLRWRWDLERGARRQCHPKNDKLVDWILDVQHRMHWDRGELGA